MIPFIVVTFITLFAFAYMYFIHNNGEEALWQSFKNTFSSFVSGPDETMSTLDFLFGFLIVIVLLNVVIAIVSDAWSKSEEKARKAFWKYRFYSLKIGFENFKRYQFFWLGYNLSSTVGLGGSLTSA